MPQRRSSSKTRRAWGSLSKRGSKYYLRYADEDGRRHMVLAGETLDAAEDFLRLRRAEVARSRAGSVIQSKTLADWWDEEYVYVLASRQKESVLRSVHVHLQRLVNWSQRDGADPPMHAFGREDAEAFVAKLAAEGLQPSYVRRMVTTLRGAWNDAITRNLATHNPWVKLKIAAPRPTHVPWVTPEQLVAIYAAVPETARPAIALIGETGLRAGEAQALLRGDVDLRNDSPRVIVRDGKTRAARRTVPLTPRAVDVCTVLLAAAGAEDDPLLEPQSQQWLRVALAQACESVGVERLKVHSLRHVYASHLVQCGLPPPTVAALLGHADGGALVMRLYGRWMPHDAQTRAVASLARWRDATPPEGP